MPIEDRRQCHVCNLFSYDCIQGNDEHWYCAECFNALVRCANCSELVHEDLAVLSEITQLKYCDDCYHELYDACEGCGCEVSRADAYLDDGEVLCEGCYSNRMDNEEKEVIHDYEYEPKYVFNKHSWENTTFFGIELEVEGDKEKAKDLLKELDMTSRGFYLKNDSTISGFEIVTHPFTKLTRHKSQNWYEILQWLKRKHFVAERDHNCGLHVHVNAEVLGEKQVESMCWFYYYCQSQITRFSRRTSEQISSYARFPSLTNCLDFRRRTYGSDYYDHYNAVSFKTNKKTHEFRIFCSTLNFQRFLASLQFVDASIAFIHNTSVAFFRRSTERSAAAGRNNERVWSAFSRFIIQTSEWGHLTAYLSKGGLLCV